jgi:hypothetical protein
MNIKRNITFEEVLKMIRKCKGCGKELDVGNLEGHSVSTRITYTGSFNNNELMPWGGVEMYCDDCYKKFIDKSNSENEDLN